MPVENYYSNYRRSCCCCCGVEAQTAGGLSNSHYITIAVVAVVVAVAVTSASIVAAVRYVRNARADYAGRIRFVDRAGTATTANNSAAPAPGSNATETNASGYV